MKHLFSIQGVVIHARHFTEYHQPKTDFIVKDAQGIEFKIATDGNLSVRNGSRISALQIKDAGTRKTLLVINEGTGEFVSNAVIAPGFGLIDMMLFFPGAILGVMVFHGMDFPAPATALGASLFGAIAVGIHFARWRTNLENRANRHHQKLIRQEFTQVEGLSQWAKVVETKMGFNHHLNVMPS